MFSMMGLTREELDLCRQWFNAVQDVSPEYLGAADCALMVRISERLGYKVDAEVRKRAGEAAVDD